MPSTYSPNLRIELIASGEQANTWGITTNNNLGTLLEQSIAGVVSVDISAADVNLSQLNGLSDQSRNMVIEATGTPPAIRTITCPNTATKVYVVVNTTAYALIFKTLSGSGVTVPAGTRRVVFSDGTNVSDCVTSTAQLTLDSAPSTSAQATTKGYVDSAIATVTAAVAAVIPSGTRMLFYQAAAPTGWTQYTALNDYALRLVSGTGGSTGGSVAFSSAFASQAVTGSISINAITSTSGSTTLTASQIPSHTHNFSATGSSTTAGASANIQDPGHTHGVNGYINTNGGGAGDAYGTTHNEGGSILAAATGVYDAGHAHNFSVSISGTTDNGTGGNGGHTHSISLSPTGSFTGNNINLAVQYANVIICTKN